MTKYIIDGEDLTSLADAIREQTGETGALSLDAMKVSIGNISGTNFNIVGGTTEPANPSENTIWVNTDVEITSWAFSATEPKNSIEGMVWIFMGTSSNAEFNALEKNIITINPLSAQQYVNGAWLSKSAQSYINSSWVGWLKDLYVDGSEWSTRGLPPNGDWKYTQTPTATKNSDGSTSLALNVTGSGCGGVWELKTDVDLTDYSTLVLQCKAESPSSQVGEVVHLIVMNRSTTYWMTSPAAIRTIPNTSAVFETYTLDISNLNGKYDVALGLRWNGAWLGAATVTARVYDVGLRK